MSKHQPVKIEILSGEGYSHANVFPRCIESDDPAQLWRDAQDQLRIVAILTGAPPREQGGYNKTDFRITFDDGTSYDGRIDLRADGLGDDSETLLEHVRFNVLYHAGKWEPQWWQEVYGSERIQELRDDIAARSEPHLELFTNYDFGDCMTTIIEPVLSEQNRQVQAFGLEERIRSRVGEAQLADIEYTADCFELARSCAVASDVVSDGVASAVEIVAARLSEGLVPDPPQAQLHEARTQRDAALREQFGSRAPEPMDRQAYFRQRTNATQVVEDKCGAECFASSPEQPYGTLGPLVRYYGAVDERYYTLFREPNTHADVLQAMREQSAVIDFQEDEGVKL